MQRWGATWYDATRYDWDGANNYSWRSYFFYRLLLRRPVFCSCRSVPLGYSNNIAGGCTLSVAVLDRSWLFSCRQQYGGNGVAGEGNKADNRTELKLTGNLLVSLDIGVLLLLLWWQFYCGLDWPLCRRIAAALAQAAKRFIKRKHDFHQKRPGLPLVHKREEVKLQAT